MGLISSISVTILSGVSIYQFLDSLRGFNAVHYWHLDVHDYHSVIKVHTFFISTDLAEFLVELVHSLLAVSCLVPAELLFVLFGVLKVFAGATSDFNMIFEGEILDQGVSEYSPIE